MKVAIFLTCYHRLEELELYAQFLKKAPPIYESWDPILFCYNDQVSDQQLKDSLRGFSQNRLTVIRSKQNWGWQFASFEGLVQAYQQLRTYDVVLHTHQNVYIVQGGLMEKLIQFFHSQPYPLATSEVMTLDRLNQPASLVYTTDFFAFKPKEIDPHLFLDYPKDDSDFIAEDFLKKLSDQHLLRPMIWKRFYLNQFHRELDYIGLWHEHDQDRVRNYLQDPESISFFEFDFQNEK